MNLCKLFIELLHNVSGVKIVGPPSNEHRCGVFSLNFEEHPAVIANRLEVVSGIKCRAGLHCAPLAHETMGTNKCGGTVRVSFGAFHTSEDIHHLVDAIEQCLMPAMIAR